MPRKLTKKQKGFIRDYLDTGNGTKAALNNYDTKDYLTAAVIASENLNKPKIKEEIEERIVVAKSIVYEIAINGENDEVKLKAAKDIIDRGEGKAVERSINVNLPVSIDISGPVANKYGLKPSTREDSE